MKFKQIADEIQGRLNAFLAFVAVFLSLGSFISQMVNTIKGPELILEIPKVVTIYEELCKKEEVIKLCDTTDRADADTEIHLNVTANLTYVNTGEPGYDDIVKKEYVSIKIYDEENLLEALQQLDIQSIEEAEAYQIPPKRLEREIQLTGFKELSKVDSVKKDDDIIELIIEKGADVSSFPVTTGNVVAREVQFIPLGGKSLFPDSYIRLAEFRELIADKKILELEFSAETYSGKISKASCYLDAGFALAWLKYEKALFVTKECTTHPALLVRG